MKIAIVSQKGDRTAADSKPCKQLILSPLDSVFNLVYIGLLRIGWRVYDRPTC